MGISRDELSKSLIRGLHDDLKWQIVAFNPKTIEDTVERIILTESSCQWKTKGHCNTAGERISTQRTNDVFEKLMQKIAELESSLEACKKSLYEQNRTDDNNHQKFSCSTTNRRCRYCGKDNHGTIKYYSRDNRQTTTYNRGGSYNETVSRTDV